MKLYRLTCSKNTIDRFDKSIVKKIPLNEVKSLISPDIIKKLSSDKISIWGFKNGKDNDKKWKQMEAGDSVFFLKWKSDGISNIIAKGTVVAKEKNVPLAKKTWGLDNDETWEQLFYLNDVELTQITVYHKNLVKKSGENYPDCAIQGSSIIDKTNPNYNYFINLLVGDITYPSETNDPCDYREGSLKKVFVNKYERNQIARNKCIELKGSQCLICGFNFGTIYGEDFKEFIHVHHLIPLHEIGKDYEINPEKDLIPICPNCHAAIHILLSKYPNLTGQESVEQLRSLITK